MAALPAPARARVRLVEPGDAERLADLRVRDREFLAPWDPVRPDAFFTTAGQLDLIEAGRRLHDAGDMLPLVVLDDEGVVVGQMNLSGIVRGPFQSGNLGYWVASTVNGRGFASSAVGATLALAFGELGLHRVQAATLPHNAASQRVLAKNGFERIGFAPRYLRIAGRWQDHVLFQRLSDD
ncbi:GNAT family N-acetyltransferase [Agromyces aurantiacus]|uniref:GNAT family N-acetyltransferase n=1 Tax=Agromyces aurantiacus TaxID=165814 RepID=A0ABV9R1R4_9MICO|nr:GNAT family N-acetyltransferase [Agromyces aurantiacus]MBM7505867.1 ribosomal-protein-alanine N-acetyltransferase [Agromyces aurantiacus]